MNDRDRVRAFERDWERRRQQDLERERLLGYLSLIAAVGLFVAAFGITVGWW